jgi:hypothetical protein
MFFAEMTHSDTETNIKVAAVLELPFEDLDHVEKVVNLMKPSFGAQVSTIFTYFRRPDCTVAEVVTINANGEICHTRGAPDSPAMLAFIETRQKLGDIVLPQRYIVKSM